VNIIMKYILLFSTAAFLFFVCFSCSSPTAPKGGNTLLDTTSNNFTWQVDTIGAQGSVLYDCCVVNDTLAYAVGSINLPGGFYNLAKWNGTNWSYFTLKGFPPGSGGDSAYGAGNSVFANSTNDVWVVAGFVFHFDGNTWKVFYNTGAEDANKIWSDGANDLWAVGIDGMIVHYVNGSWTKIQTGTTLPFQDIWGDGGQVLAIASDKFGLGGKYLISLNGNTATVLNDSIPTAVSLSGIWFAANKEYYLVGDGVLTKNSLSSKVWNYDYNRTAASYYSFAVRGDGLNNIVIAGGFGDVSFYNGARWNEYKELYNQIDQLRSVSIKGNTIVAAGIRTYNGIQYYGVVYVGRR
jgi:hypothetical protein